MTGLEEECYDEDNEIVTPNEFEFEYNVSSPTLDHIDDISPIPKVEEQWTGDTVVIDGVTYPCYIDHELMMLEELAYSKDTVCESYDLKMVDPTIDTSFDHVSCDVSLGDTPILEEEEVVDFAYLFYEDDGVLPIDLGEAIELSKDTGDPILPDILYDVSEPLPKSQSGDRASTLEIVPIPKANLTFQRIPNLGLELCVSKVLLDYFAQHAPAIVEPHSGYVHDSLPDNYHDPFDPALIPRVPLGIVVFVDQFQLLVTSKLKGSSCILTVSLALLCHHISVKLSLFARIIFWVDPQIFRLLLYGEFLCYCLAEDVKLSAGWEATHAVSGYSYSTGNIFPYTCFYFSIVLMLLHYHVIIFRNIEDNV